VGGVHRMELFDQIKADLLNLPVEVCQVPEAAAVGAALLAGVGTGDFGSARQAAASLRYQPRMIAPNPNRVSWYEVLYQEIYKPIYPHLRAIHRTISRESDKTMVEPAFSEPAFV